MPALATTVPAGAHAAAVRALLSPVRLFEGQRPQDSVAELPCVVLFLTQGVNSRTVLAPHSSLRQVTFQLTYVGLDPAGVWSVAERAQQAVLDQRPVVPGRQTSPVVQDASQPLRLDRDVTPHVFMAVDVFSFISLPLPES